MDETYLTPGEVAATLRVSRMTVNRLIHSGELPALRVGGSWRIERADFEKYKANAKASA